MIVFASLGWHQGFKALFLMPIFVTVLILNASHKFRYSKFLFIYGVLLIVFVMTLADRRTGIEYLLMATACSSVLIFESVLAIITTFFIAAGSYMFYAWFDTVHPFVEDPLMPYSIVKQTFLFISVFMVMIQSALFRSIINTFGKKLESTNHELKASNQELLTLKDQLDWIVKQKSTELKSYMDAIDIHVYSAVIDRTGKILKANVPFLHAVGYSKEELIGQNFEILNSGYHSKLFFKELYRRISDGQTWRGEIQEKTKSGNLIWTDSVVLPLTQQKFPSNYYLILSLPITQRKIVENERIKASNILETIAFRTSHKIRGPLVRLLGLTDLVQKGMIRQEELSFIASNILQAGRDLDTYTSELTQYVNERQKTFATNPLGS